MDPTKLLQKNCKPNLAYLTNILPIKWLTTIVKKTCPTKLY
jgi:hypothetical protein